MQAKLRKTATGALLGAMKMGGVFRRSARSENRRNSLLILCYHGLSLADEHRWLPKLFITPDGFRERLVALKEMSANVLPLGEAIERLHSGTLPPSSVVITFDDGFYDFYKFAAPMLREFKMPATLYLTTHYCDYRLPIVNLALDYVLWKSQRDSVELPEYDLFGSLPIRNYPERQTVVWKLVEWMNARSLKTADKDAIVKALAEKLSVDYTRLMRERMLQIMTPDEARAVFRGGVDLQLHTHRHRTPRDQALFEREILDNRNYIQGLTGQVAKHFCYPSGDYCQEFVRWLPALGVTTATTCVRGLARPDSQDMLLPRFLDDSSVDLIRFQSFVAGVWTQ